VSAPDRPALDADEIIAAARRSVGADDLGDDSLPGRLADLVAELDRRLDDPARQQAALVIRGLLEQRLGLFEDHRRLPIGEERIERPVIAFGEPRSGTTVLQMLLGCDPSSRLLEFWEVMRPSPPPGVSDPSERREQADEDWREILELIPTWLISHPYNAMLGANPPECERLWAFDFRTLPPTAWWRVPGAQFPPVRLPQDHDAQYRLHRMVLQQLQYEAPERRWVLKGTSHQHRLRALLDAYPDAAFVWIHRDPLPCIASRFALVREVYGSITTTIDLRGLAAEIVETGIRSFTAEAEDPFADDPRIVHLTYQDVTSDPFRAVRDLYDRWDLPFSDGFDAAMRVWSAENPPNRFGRFTYSADDLGTDLVELDARLDPYRERFAVPRERRER